MRLVFALVAAGGFAISAGADCRHTAPRQVAVPADGVAVVEIKAEAGSLDVEAGPAGTVKAAGTACSSDADLRDIRLEARRAGDRLIVEALVGARGGAVFGWARERRLDFTVQVPSNVRVEIEDGGREISIRDVAAARVVDGSGEIEVRGVRGGLTIQDGSGEIEIENCGGPIKISDGSGEIEIRNVRGDVTIEEDGSGAIDVIGVTGNLLVEADGSGSIDVRDVGGDFTVRRDGSGGLAHHGVRGRVSVPRD
jgi:DUF4097 and DUF4098 domain-containing protein YvlB